ncbi:Unknown protein, partial [Striga hermonthica]
ERLQVPKTKSIISTFLSEFHHFEHYNNMPVGYIAMHKFKTNEPAMGQGQRGGRPGPKNLEGTNFYIMF